MEVTLFKGKKKKKTTSVNDLKLKFHMVTAAFVNPFAAIQTLIWGGERHFAIA